MWCLAVKESDIHDFHRLQRCYESRIFDRRLGKENYLGAMRCLHEVNRQKLENLW